MGAIKWRVLVAYIVAGGLCWRNVNDSKRLLGLSAESSSFADSPLRSWFQGDNTGDLGDYDPVYASSETLEEASSLRDTAPPFSIFMNAFIPAIPNHQTSDSLAVQIIQEQLMQIDKATARALESQQQQQQEHREESSSRINHYNNVTVYFVTLSGRTLNATSLEQICNKNVTPHINCVHWKHVGNDTVWGGETDTLSEFHSYCRDTIHKFPNARAAYIHNKGSFHPSRQNTRWRRVLTDAIIHPDCVNPPLTNSTEAAEEDQQQQCDVCGLNFATPPRMFTTLFPGNFFTASCQYVNRLLPPKEYSDKLQTLNKQVVRTRIPPHFSFTLKTQKPWAIGAGRYAPEHWIGSHPSLKPCQLSVPPDYFYWEDHDHKIHYKSHFDFSVFPDTRPGGRLREDNEFWGVYLNSTLLNNTDLRLRDYSLLGGLLFRWTRLYNNTIPPDDSWLWSWLPDGDFWKRAVQTYGAHDAPDIVMAPNFNRSDNLLPPYPDDDDKGKDIRLQQHTAFGLLS